MTRTARSITTLCLSLSLFGVACTDDAADPTLAPPAGAPGALGVTADGYAEYGRLAPVTEGRALADAELEHELELRAAYGLSTEREHVVALHRSPARFRAQRSRDGMFAALLLAEDELPLAVERAEVEYHGEAGEAWARDALGPAFAGAFVLGRRLVIQCAGCEPRALEAALADAELPTPLRGRIEVRAVEHSLDALTAAETRLAAFLAAERLPHNGTTVDVVGDRVELRVTTAQAPGVERRRDELVGVAGVPLVVVHDRGDGQLDLNKNQALGYALVEGGQAIGTSPGSAACTSGFAVQSGFGPFILTAGHCTGLDQPWYQGGALLGYARATQNSGSFDAALITTYNIRNNWGRVHVSTFDDAHPVTFGVTTHGLLNQTVCQTGFVTTGMDGLSAPSTRCGVVTSLTYRPAGAYNATFGRATYVRNHGDSGAAVYWPTGYGFGAAGLHSRSVNEAASPGIFSRFSVVASAWGLTVSPF